MTFMWFGLAAIALVGAVALLYIDRSRRDQLGRVRQMWAKAQGYTYTADDENIVSTFKRAALAKPEHTVALDLVSGVRRGEKFVLFDVEETSTIVAVQRPVGSDVDIDLRLRSTPPPRDQDMELLGSIGPRVVFATNVEVARRVCDQRMAAFTESVPENISLIWSENDWTLGSLPLGSTGRDWDAAIDAVARLSGMLHVLPPVARRPASNARSEVPPRRRTESSNVRKGADVRPTPEEARRHRGEEGRPTSILRDAPRPDAPETQRPDSQRPETQRPETQRPETQRPDAQRPEPRPPLRSVPGRPLPAGGPVPRQGPSTRVPPPSRPSPIVRDTDS